MAGAQEDMASSTGHALWIAREELLAAQRAPYTGSASREALKNAERRHIEAASSFDRAYTEYSSSMRRVRLEPRSRESFITR